MKNINIREKRKNKKSLVQPTSKTPKVERALQLIAKGVEARTVLCPVHPSDQTTLTALHAAVSPQGNPPGKCCDEAARLQRDAAKRPLAFWNGLFCTEIVPATDVRSRRVRVELALDRGSKTAAAAAAHSYSYFVASAATEPGMATCNCRSAWVSPWVNCHWQGARRIVFLSCSGRTLNAFVGNVFKFSV